MRRGGAARGGRGGRHGTVGRRFRLPPSGGSARYDNAVMRTTVRIDDDLMIALKARAHAESVSLTRVLNRTLRAGLDRPRPPRPDGSRTRPFVQKTAAMGRPKVDLDKALALAARLEDEDVARKLSRHG